MADGITPYDAEWSRQSRGHPKETGPMTEHVTRSPVEASRSRTTTTLVRMLSVVTAVLLGVDAFVHLNDASRFDSFKSSVMSEGTLFRIQAVVAIVVAVAVLIWPRVLTWVLSIVVAGSAAVAVVLYTYVNVGALGPLPNLYENTWSVPGKVGSAVAETAAALVAIVGLVLTVRMRRRSAH
jgi:glucan phosphoethanolaminetransferase (alkaline phosphatase superfamily)